MNRPLDSLIKSENDRILTEVQEMFSCRGNWGIQKVEKGYFSTLLNLHIER